MLPNNARPNQGGQLEGRAPLGIVEGTLEDRDALARDGVLEDLAELDRRQVRWAVRVGVRRS